MIDLLTRRGILAGALGLGTAHLAAGPALADARAAQTPPDELATVPVAKKNGLRLFTSVDGVKLAGSQQFSFAWPEPAAPFVGLHFAFEIITFENAYAVDPDLTHLDRSLDGLTFTASGFTWAGGQERRAGRLFARLNRLPDGTIRWHVETEFPESVKAVKTIVRGLPRGRISMSANDWQDLGEIDVRFEYPLLAGGMATPPVAIEAPDKQVWGISAVQHEVRPTRFFLQPGAGQYRAELIYEQAGWQKTGAVRTHQWEIFRAPDFPALAQRYFIRLENDLGISQSLQRDRTLPNG